MTAIHIDFETRSACDLKKAGVHVYAEHPTTDVWCMAYALGDAPVQIWTMGQDFPTELGDAIDNDEDHFIAHNAAFELALWNGVMAPRYGWPPLPLEKTHCTMVMAYAMGLPGSLENAGAAAGLTIKKDMEGRSLMMRMCRPRSKKDEPIVWWEEKDKLERLYAYCKNDVEVERALDKRLVRLSASEREMWILDQKINNRGILVDVPSVEKILDILANEKVRLDRAIRGASSGFVKNTRAVTSITQMVEMNGVPTNGIDKREYNRLINGGALDARTLHVLDIRREAGKTSTAKFKSMVDGAGKDGRIRGTLQYYGAHTGRWSGRRLQVQNLPRSKLSHSEIEDVIRTGLEDRSFLELTFGEPLSVLSDTIRGMLIAAPGKRFITADFSAIEARVLAWLAGEEKVLEVFRSGGDIYKVAAGDIFGKQPGDVTKAERQVGKTAVLALGYQGGVGAFAVMARGYGVDMALAHDALVSRASAEAMEWAERMYAAHCKEFTPSTEGFIPREAYIASELTKSFWRKANPNIVAFWNEVENKSVIAITGTSPEETPTPKSVRFKRSGSFLFTRLPSGRCIVYPYPSVKDKKTPWGGMKQLLHYKHMNISNRWEETSTYGGKLAENITQAVARDLLSDAIKRLEAKGYKVVMHVHDEIICEVDEDFGSVAEMEEIMSEVPAWAKGCPIDAEGWEGTRYRK